MNADIIPWRTLELRIAASREIAEPDDTEVEKLPFATRMAIIGGLSVLSWTFVGTIGYAIYRIV